MYSLVVTADCHDVSFGVKPLWPSIVLPRLIPAPIAFTVSCAESSVNGSALESSVSVLNISLALTFSNLSLALLRLAVVADALLYSFSATATALPSASHDSLVYLDESILAI